MRGIRQRRGRGEKDVKSQDLTLRGSQVYKFYKGKRLKEIAFFPYNNKYRVYEIAFRTDEGEKEGKTK